MSEKKDEALKLALEALSPWAGEDANHTEQYAAYHALRERLAQPEQKTCLVANEPCKHGSWCSEVYCQEHCKFAQPAQQQEPVFWYRPVGDDGGYEGPIHNSAIEKVRKMAGTWKPLYTSPPASKPLTDDQIMEMYNEPRSDAEMIEFARAIEAAHGIKGDA